MFMARHCVSSTAAQPHVKNRMCASATPRTRTQLAVSVLQSEGALALHGDMKDDIDPEMLISLVKRTPILWDRSQEGYKSRICTKNAWRGVCANMNPSFRKMSEVYQENYEKHLVKKWRNIKDNYIKSRKKLKPANRKKYIFHKHLTFLDTSMDVQEMKRACSSDNEESEPTDPLPALEDTRNDADSCTDIKPDVSFLITKMDDQDISEECMIPDTMSSTAVYPEDNPPFCESFSNEPCASAATTSRVNSDTEMLNQTSVEENRHMLFFKSVLPSLKDFTDDDTLEFQAVVIRAIRDIKRQCANISKNGSSQQEFLPKGVI